MRAAALAFAVFVGCAGGSQPAQPQPDGLTEFLTPAGPIFVEYHRRPQVTVVPPDAPAQLPVAKPVDPPAPPQTCTTPSGWVLAGPCP